MLLKDYVIKSRAALAEIYSAEEAAALVGILCTEYLGVQSYTYMVNPACEIKDKLLARANAALQRLMDNEPIQYVLGYSEFMGERFNLSSSVLIPRPETEMLCKTAIEAAMIIYRNRSAYGKDAKPVRILDLCTGSGCIAWTMALNVPGAEVVAVDISPDALEVARNQPFDLGRGKNPVFHQLDITDDEAVKAFFDTLAPFDIVLSNPPYVLESEKSLMRKNVLDYEPPLALFVSDDDNMKFNKKIAEIASSYMYTDATGFVEINEALGGPAMAIFRAKGFSDCELLKDIFGKIRFVKFRK